MWWCSTAPQPSTFVMWLFFTAVRNLRGCGGEATERNPSDFRAPFLLQLLFFYTRRLLFFLVNGKKVCLFFWTEGHLTQNQKVFSGQGPSSSEKIRSQDFFGTMQWLNHFICCRSPPQGCKLRHIFTQKLAWTQVLIDTPQDQRSTWKKAH